MSLIKRKYWLPFLSLALASLFLLYAPSISDPLTRGTNLTGGQRSSRLISSSYGGIVTVPPHTAVHPIYELLKHGEQEARRITTVRESVKSLEDAVRDYRFAFKMNPPEGFERWYELAVKLNSTTAPSLIPLAHKTVLPFLSLPPALFRKRVKEVIPLKAMVGLQVTPEAAKNRTFMTPLDEVASRRPTPKQWHWMINSDIDRLPPSQDPQEPLWFAFWTDDSTFRMVDGGLREDSINLALRGQTWDGSELEQRETETRIRRGWPWTCPPTSWLSFDGIMPLQRPEGKHFVLDPKAAGDYCLHPSLMEQNGELIMRYDYPMRPLAPVIAIGRPLHGTDIVGPTTLRHDSIIKDPLPWSSKNESRLLWRGQPSGIYHIDRFPWRQSHRDRLSSFGSSRRNDTVELILDKGSGVQMETHVRNASELVEEYLNIGVINEAIPWHCGVWGANQIICHDEEIKFEDCPGKGKACKEMEKELEWKERVETGEAQRYKFILDVDGYGWSSRWRKELSSGSVVIKTTIYPEWWSEQAVPWYHYIPSLYDYSDLFDIMSFFTGTGSPKEVSEEHDHLAEAIGQRVREFAMNQMRWEDMRVYMFLLVLEYRRAWSDDRIAATYRPVD